MQIIIDGNKINANGHKNIVDAAYENGIAIPAPCYTQGRKHGCCHVCAVRVDGDLKYACTTKPEDGMTIEVNKPDLVDLRKENLAIYAKAVKNNETLPCDCGSGCSDDGCGCGCGEEPDSGRGCDDTDDSECGCGCQH